MLSAINVGFFNQLKTWPTVWATGVVRAVGDIIKPTSYNSHTYVCTTAGTSHAATEPTWSTTNGGTTTDGTAVFTTFDMKTYSVKSPQGATVPYVAFGLETDVPISTFASQVDIESLTYWVNVFSSTSVAHVSVITDLVLTALDNASLTITGYTGMKCVREFMGTILWDLETGIFQCPLRYRVWADKT